jgi:predicted nucleic acid-binding protein
MKTVFADTHYWVASVIPNDQWRTAAEEAIKSLGRCRVVTTDEVLSEFLNLLGGRGTNLRAAAIVAVRRILANPEVEVVAQSRASFLQGFERYADRLDKGYSLTDCISMNVMESEGIRDVLTNDHHFGQEGFSVLIQ